MPTTAFNVIISGTSVSGNLDDAHPLHIELGNSDQIGYAEFALQNKDGSFTNLLSSGDATFQIDAIQGGVTTTILRGNIEIAEPEVDISKGTVTHCYGYDQGLELLGVISPDAREPYLLTNSGTFNTLSGDAGMATLDGLDLVAFTSGINAASGATVAQFMSQWFGKSGDPSGSFSGAMFSFKPPVSGYVWSTYYLPDASGFVGANDKNTNFYIPFGIFKVKREFAWDALRKITRQSMALDANGNKVPYESYIDVSGGIHLFTSGSYEFILSGATLQYYAAGTSGSSLNNIIRGKVPHDVFKLKNRIVGWFPPWNTYPDSDLFTDFVAYSGAYWSGVNDNGFGVGATLSGTSPSSPVGSISIMGSIQIGSGIRNSGGFSMTFTVFSGQSLNLSQWNVSGSTLGVALNYRYMYSGNQSYSAMRSVAIFDSGGNSIMKSGAVYAVQNGPPTQGQSTLLQFSSPGSWLSLIDPIFTSGGQLYSGDGISSGWKVTGSIDFTTITQIRIGHEYAAAGPGSGLILSLWIDNLFFSFNYPFSPVVAFNSGSQGLYKRRYATLEWPYSVSNTQASGIMVNELNSRMGSKKLAEFTVKDNPNGQAVQLQMRPGFVFTVDAPSLNTGSGQVFNYWRAVKVMHEWSIRAGFITIIHAMPWFSGTLTAPITNTVDYQVPVQYQPPPERESYAPVTRPWFAPGSINRQG